MENLPLEERSPSAYSTLMIITFAVAVLALLTIVAYPIGGMALLVLLWIIAPVTAIYLYHRRDRTERPPSPHNFEPNETLTGRYLEDNEPPPGPL